VGERRSIHLQTYTVIDRDLKGAAQLAKSIQKAKDAKN
jgi:hypothetical protein